MYRVMVCLALIASMAALFSRIVIDADLREELSATKRSLVAFSQAKQDCDAALGKHMIRSAAYDALLKHITDTVTEQVKLEKKLTESSCTVRELQ